MFSSPNRAQAAAAGFFIVAGFLALLPASAGEKCKISCIEPHAKCPDSVKVIEILKEMTAALSHGDFDRASEYLDDGCTTFDKGSHKLIVGKQAVIDDIKKRADEHKAGSAEPLVSFTIDHPYAKVDGDTAVVTFVAHKEFGGEKPKKMESRCTDIFVRRGDTWKKLHYRSDWKKAK